MRYTRTRAGGGSGRARAGAAAALLTAALALTGCGAPGSGAGAASDSKAHDRAAQPANGGAARGAAGASGGGQAPASAPSRTPAAQHVIRTAELAVRVRDAAGAADTARRAAVDAGGLVENETTERTDDAGTTARLVLRVPQERYDAVLARLAGTGTLLSRTASAKDVTDQVVDVESRIASQRASVARVRALMNKADRLGDVVTLESELSRRQADLEALLAQQASLKDRTELATVTLSLTEPPAAPAAGDEGDDRPGFLDALGGGWHALVVAVAWLLVVLGALGPWLAVAALGYAAWRWGVRPRLARRTRPEPEPEPVPASGSGPGPGEGA